MCIREKRSSFGFKVWKLSVCAETPAGKVHFIIVLLFIYEKKMLFIMHLLSFLSTLWCVYTALYFYSSRPWVRAGVHSAPLNNYCQTALGTEPSPYQSTLGPVESPCPSGGLCVYNERDFTPNIVLSLLETFPQPPPLTWQWSNAGCGCWQGIASGVDKRPLLHSPIHS